MTQKQLILLISHVVQKEVFRITLYNCRGHSIKTPTLSGLFIDNVNVGRHRSDNLLT